LIDARAEGVEQQPVRDTELGRRGELRRTSSERPCETSLDEGTISLDRTAYGLVQITGMEGGFPFAERRDGAHGDDARAC
jgi:hypothetical protein